MFRYNSKTKFKYDYYNSIEYHCYYLNLMRKNKININFNVKKPHRY